MSISSDSGDGREKDVEVIQDVVADYVSSGEDPPMSQWSSLESLLFVANKKKVLHSKGLYSPGSGEICTKYIRQSDSSVFRHVYYNYPAVTDPGIKDALLHPEKPVIYPNDGQDLYLSLCEEMNKCPIKLFHKNLLSDEINLRYYCVDPFSVRAMAMALQYNKYVNRLDLTDNFLNDDACYHLGKMLQSNVTLKKLILSGCRIGKSGLVYLMKHLRVNRSLITLDLSRNELGDDGGEYFARQLDHGVAVPNVNLSSNQLGKLTAAALTEALEYNMEKIKQLDLSKNSFTQVVPTAKLLNILSQSNVLQRLNLAWNALEGGRIAETIKNILLVPTLVELDLSNNRFRGGDILAIASNLIKAKKLVTLDLSRNSPLTADDALVLIDKMKKPSVKLKNLLLENVDVPKEFLDTLNKVRSMKSRKNFYITYGHVLNNWEISGPDARKVILQRALYLGNKDKKHRVDIPVFFLRLNKLFGSPIQGKDLEAVVRSECVPLDGDFLKELCVVFPAPAKKGMVALNLASVCDYVKRLWPDSTVPPTPEEEPELPPQPPAKEKGKGKKK
nr:LOW QUALITY PROTEIN: leucine-rich repeat-containing protein 74B-like [Plodia interpunctella]